MLQQFDERNRDLIVNVGGRLVHRDEAGVSPFDSAVQGGELHETPGCERNPRTDPVLVQIVENAHALEEVAVERSGVVDGHAHLDARFQELTELDDAGLGRAARFAHRRRAVAHAARGENRALLGRGEQRMDELQVRAEQLRLLELRNRAGAGGVHADRQPEPEPDPARRQSVCGVEPAVVARRHGRRSG